MTVEQRLRDAMQARVEGVNAPAMAVRPERPRRVWPAVAAGFAIVLVVAVVVAVIARGDGGEDAVHPAATPYPSRIVAVTYDGRLVVLDSRTGRVVRTLARDADASNGHAGVSVSPDGKFAYYTRTTAATCDENLDGKQEPITDIAAVRVSGQGRAMRVAANVRWPAVSPDGRYLAYSGIPNCSDAGQAIVISGLVPGARGLRFDSVNVPAGTPGTVYGLAWAPDSRHLLFHWDIGSTYPYVLDTAAAGAIDDGHRVDIGDGSSVDGFLGDRSTLSGTSAQASPSSRGDVVAVDPASGARTRTLFEIPGPWPGSVATSDATGRNILVSGARLFRWSEGERRLTRIGGKVAAATWVPGRATPAPAPREIVASASASRLIVASADDGHMLRVLAADYQGSGFVVSPDGRTVYYTRPSRTVCENPAGPTSYDIVAVPTSGGTPTVVETDAVHPVLSPDGRLLAYSGLVNCSPSANAITVRDVADQSVPDRSWSVAPGSAVGRVTPYSLVWLDDHRIRFGLLNEQGQRVLDIDQEVSLDAAPVAVVQDLAWTCCRVGAAEAVAATDAGSLWTVDAATGQRIRELTCCGQPVDVDPSGRHLLVTFTDPTHPPVLYRYTIGEPRLVPIASFLYEAAWLPGS